MRLAYALKGMVSTYHASSVCFGGNGGERTLSLS